MQSSKKEENNCMDVRMEWLLQATIYFPLKALEAVLALDISEEMKEKIINTKNVGKSKPCIFEIRSKEVIVDFEKVMNLKIVSK